MKKRIAVYTMGNTQEELEKNKIKVNHILEVNGYSNADYDITYYEDIGYSATDNHRPDLESLILSMENMEVDILVTPKIETLSRNFLFMEFEFYPTLLDFNVDLVTMNGKENILEKRLPHERIVELMNEKYGGFENEM